MLAYKGNVKQLKLKQQTSVGLLQLLYVLPVVEYVYVPFRWVVFSLSVRYETRRQELCAGKLVAMPV